VTQSWLFSYLEFMRLPVAGDVGFGTHRTSAQALVFSKSSALAAPYSSKPRRASKVQVTAGLGGRAGIRIDGAGGRPDGGFGRDVTGGRDYRAGQPISAWDRARAISSSDRQIRRTLQGSERSSSRHLIRIRKWRTSSRSPLGGGVRVAHAKVSGERIPAWAPHMADQRLRATARQAHVS